MVDIILRDLARLSAGDWISLTLILVPFMGFVFPGPALLQLYDNKRKKDKEEKEWTL
jgi:hypothetical protein